MIAIEIFRRLLNRSTDEGPAGSPVGAGQEVTVLPPATPTAPAVPPPSCPYCGALLDPPPTGARRCLRCRQRIVVRHVDGRVVYLTEAAVSVFDGERQRTADEHRWLSERRSWLRLAASVGATAERRHRIERATLSADSVHAARTLYLTTVERDVHAARRAKRWHEVATLRREQAAVLFQEAGSPVPPPADALRFHQEAANAALRAMADTALGADLVGASCCAACRADDGKTFRIADELRVPRLPHAGCPRGLCECDWWIATVAPRRRRRGAKSTGVVAIGASADRGGPSAAPADGVAMPPDAGAALAIAVVTPPDSSAAPVDAVATGPEPSAAPVDGSSDVTVDPIGPSDDPPGPTDAAS